MKKKKLTIHELKLKSFITSSDSLNRLYGGADESYNDGWSDGDGCPKSGNKTNNCPPPLSSNCFTNNPVDCYSFQPTCDGQPY